MPKLYHRTSPPKNDNTLTLRSLENKHTQVFLTLPDVSIIIMALELTGTVPTVSFTLYQLAKNLLVGAKVRCAFYQQPPRKNSTNK